METIGVLIGLIGLCVSIASLVYSVKAEKAASLASAAASEAQIIAGEVREQIRIRVTLEQLLDRIAYVRGGLNERVLGGRSALDDDFRLEFVDHLNGIIERLEVVESLDDRFLEHRSDLTEMKEAMTVGNKTVTLKGRRVEVPEAISFKLSLMKQQLAERIERGSFE